MRTGVERVNRLHDAFLEQAKKVLREALEKEIRAYLTGRIKNRVVTFGDSMGCVDISIKRRNGEVIYFADWVDTSDAHSLPSHFKYHGRHKEHPLCKIVRAYADLQQETGAYCLEFKIEF